MLTESTAFVCGGAGICAGCQPDGAPREGRGHPGSTGSIGVSTLDVVARHPERYQVVALECASRCSGHARPVSAVPPEPGSDGRSGGGGSTGAGGRRRGSQVEVMVGAVGTDAVATHPDATDLMAGDRRRGRGPADTGSGRLGRRILLANKEALVVSGALFMAAAQARRGGRSCRSTVSTTRCFNAYPGSRRRPDRVGVEQILLTASVACSAAAPVRVARCHACAGLCPPELGEMGRARSRSIPATMMN